MLGVGYGKELVLEFTTRASVKIPFTPLYQCLSTGPFYKVSKSCQGK